jgi:hypothetical protein
MLFDPAFNLTGTVELAGMKKLPPALSLKRTAVDLVRQSSWLDGHRVDLHPVVAITIDINIVDRNRAVRLSITHNSVPCRVGRPQECHY